eukprot:m.193205 g.193205  ORF g.193205 m.193205 type:complete len:117 (-) comp53681_c0_seq7:32-382(-)
MVALTDSEHEQNRARIGSQTKPALREQEAALESTAQDQAPAGSIVIRLDEDLGARPAEPEFQEGAGTDVGVPQACLEPGTDVGETNLEPLTLQLQSRQMAPAMNLALTDLDLELIE